MRKCLFLVEGPYDEQRLSLIQDLFDENKIIIVPFTNDKLTKNDYYSNYSSEISSLLSIAHTYDISDFDLFVQICDTDGCFIPDSDVKENKGLKHIEYYSSHIEVSDRNGLLGRRANKRTNIEYFLSNQNKIKLYYNSTNIDHAFDNIQNPTQKQKKSFALQMSNNYRGNARGFIQKLIDVNTSNIIDYNDSWNYIKRGYNSLTSSSNIIIFLLDNYADLKDESKTIIDELIGKNEESK